MKDKIRQFLNETHRSNSRKLCLLRVIGKSIDIGLVLLITAIFYPVGSLIGVAYLAFCDQQGGKYSVGKNMVGLKVIHFERPDLPLSYSAAFIRNLPFIIPLAFLVIPVIGAPFAFLIGIPLCGLEVYFLYNLDSKQRLGDVLAKTQVISSVLLDENDKVEVDIEKTYQPRDPTQDSWFD